MLDQPNQSVSPEMLRRLSDAAQTVNTIAAHLAGVAAAQGSAATVSTAADSVAGAAAAAMLVLTPSQRAICERVINVFETGSVQGRYGAIAIFADGPHGIRQVTYGRSQTTEYGNLRELVSRYVAAGGTFSEQLRPFVPRIGRTALVDNATFKDLLRRAGNEDPIMARVQDAFFDDRYFNPAMRWGGTNGFTRGLSALVIYDSFIHSGGILDFLRARFRESPPARGGNEQTWISQYTETRHNWLLTHSNPAVRASSYRTADLLREIGRGNWDLAMVPIMANGTPVDDGGIGNAAPSAVASVAGPPPAAADAVKTDGQADAQAAAAVGAGEQAIGDTAATAIALSAATASPAPQAKAPAQSKPTLTTKDAIATAGEQDSATNSAPTEAPTGIVPGTAEPAAATGKQKAEHAFVDAVKADASGNSAQTPAPNAANHAQPDTANAAQTFAAASDNGAQAAAMIQPQVPSTPSANSQLTVTAATAHNNAVPVSGLAMEIAASANSGKSRFEIRLDPPELGRIDVRIHVDNNGQVTSHLTVERPETLQMLRQDANQLQRALDNAGLSTGNSGLQFSLRDQSSSGQNGGHQPNPNAHRLIVSDEDSVPATVAGRSYGRMLGASGGVDIRV